MKNNVNKLYIKLVNIRFSKDLLNMITLYFSKFGDPLGKRWAAPLDHFGVEIPERSSNGDFKRFDGWLRGCIGLLFNHAEQQIVTYNQIWWATRPHVFRQKSLEVLLQVSLDLFRSKRWRRVLNKHGFVRIVVFKNPEQKNTNQGLQILFCVFFSPASIKWGCIIFHSLATAAKTITEAVFCSPSQEERLMGYKQ